MQTSTYMLNPDGSYSPMNMMAVGGVRCVECSQLCHPDAMEAHMATHVSSRFFQSAGHPAHCHSKAKPLSLSTLLQEEEPDDISVRSVMKDELPDEEVHRKKIIKCGGDGYRMASPQISPLQTMLAEEEDFDHEELQTGMDYPDYENPIILNKKVVIPTCSYQVEKKKINMFQHSKHQEGHQDRQCQAAKKKSQVELESATCRGFDVVKLGSAVLETSENRNVQVVDLGPSKKKQKKFCKVSTASSAKTLTATKLNSDKKTTQNKFQCPSCHGFYCETCKSTIPPYYRPANLNYKGEDSTITDFYKATSYDCDTCKNQ